MNYTKLFYWLTVADNAKSFFLIFGIIFSIITGLSLFLYFFNSHTDGHDEQTEDDKIRQKMSRKWFWWSTPFTIHFLTQFYILVKHQLVTYS
jgi:heme/copper-type cytochrome/quinol oxidase subunit 2